VRPLLGPFHQHAKIIETNVLNRVTAERNAPLATRTSRIELKRVTSRKGGVEAPVIIGEPRRRNNRSNPVLNWLRTEASVLKSQTCMVSAVLERNHFGPQEEVTCK
jgi:hypothetical protein